MNDKQNELSDTGKDREAIADAVVERLRTGSTPKPASISSGDMEAAISERCLNCSRPGGSIHELWEAFNPIRMRVWMMTGAFIFLAAMLSYIMPRINRKLDAVEDMAKDLAALKVQMNFLIGSQHGSLVTAPSTIAKE